MRKVHAAARRNGIDPRFVKPSTRRGKKIMVVDPRTGRHVHAGHSGYADYTAHGDRAKRANYLRRARGMPHPRMSPNWVAIKLLWDG